MVRVCIFILYLYRHARIASEKNDTYLLDTVYVYKSALVQILSHTSVHHTVLLFGKCKLLGYFHVKYTFSWSLHSPCPLFPCFLFCQTKHNLITLYYPGFATYPIMPFHSSVLLSVCPLWQSLWQRLNFLSSISMLWLTHDNGKPIHCK